MNIYKEMWSITNSLDKMSGNYDSDEFIKQLGYQVDQLSFFYSFLVNKQGNDASKTFFKPKDRPKEGQVAYFNLTRGFPKELYDWHYCYVVKDFNTKLIVVPTTSVKHDSAPCNENFELDIDLVNAPNGLKSRMHIDDMRVVDVQRISVDKGFFDVTDKREDIMDFIKKVIFS